MLRALSVDGKHHSIIELTVATGYSEHQIEAALHLLSKIGLAKLEHKFAIIDPKLREIILDEDNRGSVESER